MSAEQASKGWGGRLSEAAVPLMALAALVAAAYALGEVAHTLVPALPGTVPSAFMGSYTATPRTVGETTTAFGVLLVGAWLAGRVAKALGLPRISGYLAFGVLAGPSFAGLVGITPIIGAPELGSLKLIEGLAVTLIALAAGSEIKLAFVRKSARIIATVFVGEFMSVAPVVFAMLLGILFLLPLPGALEGTPGWTRIYIAGIVALLAVADAPAVTIAILKDTRAVGLFPQLALCNTVLKDVVLVVLFSALLAVGIATMGTGDAVAAGAPGAASAVAGAAGAANAAAGAGATGSSGAAVAGAPAISPVGVALTIGLHLIGSLLLGAVGAVLFWLLARFLRMRIEIFMVMACFGIAVISEELHADALLVALSAGVILANIAPERTNERLISTIDGLLLPVYCVFFGVAGAKLQLDALAAVWPAMLAVVAVRLVAKRIGVTAACRAAKVPEPTASWLWTSTLPQAGVTLAMAIQFDRAMGAHGWATSVSALLLAVVACNEVLGPPLMKLGVQRAGAARDDP